MNRIKEIRISKNIKQADLAKMLNVSQGTLSNWERGEHDPDSQSLLILSKILDTSIDNLLGNADKKISLNKKDPPDEFQESRLLRDKLIEMGVLKEDESLNKAQINALFEIFKGNGDYIKFIIDKHK